MQYVLIAIAAALWLFGTLLLFRRLALYFGGNIVEGKLLGFRKREFRDGKRYYPVIEYRAGDSVRRETVGLFSYPSKESCGKGAKFRVLHLTSNPDRAMVYKHMQFWSGVYATLSLAMAATFGAVKLLQAAQTVSN